MLARKASTLALGTLFAVAVTLSSAIAPAFAAQPAPTESFDQFLFQPDVRVNYLGKTYSSGKTIYRFRVENIGAASIELTPDDLREIDRAASEIQVHGARYPDALEQLTGR